MRMPLGALGDLTISSARPRLTSASSAVISSCRAAARRIAASSSRSSIGFVRWLTPVAIERSTNPGSSTPVTTTVSRRRPSWPGGRRRRGRRVWACRCRRDRGRGESGGLCDRCLAVWGRPDRFVPECLQRRTRPTRITGSSSETRMRMASWLEADLGAGSAVRRRQQREAPSKAVLNDLSNETAPRPGAVPRRPGPPSSVRIRAGQSTHPVRPRRSRRRLATIAAILVLAMIGGAIAAAVLYHANQLDAVAATRPVPDR
jgi:hypothetical protein